MQKDYSRARMPRVRDGHVGLAGRRAGCELETRAESAAQLSGHIASRLAPYDATQCEAGVGGLKSALPARRVLTVRNAAHCARKK